MDRPRRNDEIGIPAERERRTGNTRRSGQPGKDGSTTHPRRVLGAPTMVLRHLASEASGG
jgi:hypothetical protein